MKKLGAGLAVLGVLLMIAVGCGSPADKVKVGMTENQVIDVLGEPMGTVNTDSSGQNRLLYMDVEGEDIMVWFKDGKVTKVDSRETVLSD
ncbi:MAG: outer membrane protein assembly factor BamE [Armatimonadetes bacterium]|nr:outer membrane protein assembly factor BamE [Armatimonadota bacterium]